jgi:WD40 repeat protein
LPLDAGSTHSDHVSIEQILQEKKTFDLSLRFEKLGVDDHDRGWHSPGNASYLCYAVELNDIAPSNPLVLQSLPTRSNILSIALLECLLPSMAEPKTYLAATTADRRLHLMDASLPTLPLALTYSAFQDSPVLDVVVIKDRYMLTASMSGKLVLYNTKTDQMLESRKDHSKYLVKLATWSEGTSTLIASAGWDAKVHFYRLATEEHSDVRLGEPIATITLSSVPETLLFIQSPDTSHPVLLLTRRDSTFMYYYTVPSLGSTNSQINLLGRQNLAPHSNAWVAFTPSDVQICPVDPLLVAVATSSTPHLKLLIVRLLLPPREELCAEPGNGLGQDTITQASQTRANLLLQDKEEAAIIVNVSTMAPQTAYSTPCLVWRPDGSGVYVSSDDGIVRGFEATTGKHTASLEAHEPGSKLRCLWAGYVKVASSISLNSVQDEEYLLSGGFDQRLIRWNAA